MATAKVRPISESGGETTVEKQPTLHKKLASITSEIDHVEKRGVNTGQNYKYVKAGDIAHLVRKQLADKKLWMISDVESIERFDIPTRNGSMGATQIMVRYTIFDGESGESISFRVPGVGADSGDKAIYKAMTGSLKYALRNMFLVPDDTDPEGDPSVDYDTKGSSAKRSAPTANQVRPVSQSDGSRNSSSRAPSNPTTEILPTQQGATQPQDGGNPATSTKALSGAEIKARLTAYSESEPTKFRAAMNKCGFNVLADIKNLAGAKSVLADLEPKPQVAPAATLPWNGPELIEKLMTVKAQYALSLPDLLDFIAMHLDIPQAQFPLVPEREIEALLDLCVLLHRNIPAASDVRRAAEATFVDVLRYVRNNFADQEGEALGMSLKMVVKNFDSASLKTQITGGE